MPEQPGEKQSSTVPCLFPAASQNPPSLLRDGAPHAYSSPDPADNNAPWGTGVLSHPTPRVKSTQPYEHPSVQAAIPVQPVPWKRQTPVPTNMRLMLRLRIWWLMSTL